MTFAALTHPAYEDYERGIMALHAMSLAGCDGSPEAERLRDQMYAPWSELTSEQRTFGDGVSGDLFMLEPEGEIYLPATEEERSPQRLGLAIQAADDRQDWVELLLLLRRGPTFFPPEYVAFLRAEAYRRLGRSAVALAFIRHARQLDPNDLDTRTIEFLLMTQVESPAEVLTAAWGHVEARSPSRLAVIAAGHLFRATRGQPADVARQTWERLAEAMRQALVAGELAADRDADELVPYGNLLLAACLDGLGEATAARQAYGVVLDTWPGDTRRAAFFIALKDYVRHRFGGSTSLSPAMDTVRFDLASSFNPRMAA